MSTIARKSRATLENCSKDLTVVQLNTMFAVFAYLVTMFDGINNRDDRKPSGQVRCSSKLPSKVSFIDVNGT
jgi:hypothetical protein